MIAATDFSKVTIMQLVFKYSLATKIGVVTRISFFTKIGNVTQIRDFPKIRFYENQTFISVNFYLNREQITDNGTWTKIESGHYTTRSSTGETTDWMHDSLFDEIYSRDLPLKKYYRYKG